MIATIPLATGNKLNCFISARGMLAIVWHCVLLFCCFFCVCFLLIFYMLINHLLKKKKKSKNPSGSNIASMPRLAHNTIVFKASAFSFFGPETC